MVIIYALALHRHASDWLLFLGFLWAWAYDPRWVSLTKGYELQSITSPPDHRWAPDILCCFSSGSNKAAHLSCLPQRYLTRSFSTAEALFFTLPCLPEGLKGIMHSGLLWDLRCLIPTLFTWQRPLALWRSWRAWTGLVFPCVLPLHLLLVRHWVYNSIF